MMNRHILNEYLRSNDGRAYRLGEWDCAIYVFAHVEAQTGVDHIAEYRGLYSTEAEAKKLMKKFDRVATVRTLANKKLGESIPPAFARTGDIVSRGGSLGILYADRAIFLAESTGYERIPRALLDRAWSIRS